MLRSTTRLSPELMEQFQRGFAAASGNAVDPEYLRRGLTRAFLDRRGTVVGGYVLNQDSPFRYLAGLPEGTRLPELPWSEFCEVACLWLAPGLGQVERALSVARGIVDLARCPRRYVLAGTVNERLMRYQRRYFPNMVYEGPLALGPEPRRGWIYYGTRADFGRGALVDLRRRLGKALGRRSD